jgi:hypothetical protein
MAHPTGGLLARSSTSHFAAAVVSVAALAIVGTGIALYGALPAHQTVNRAVKADALVGLNELKAKLSLKVASIQFFHDRQLAAPQALNQFVGAETARQISNDRPLEIVAVNKRDSIAAW